MGSKYSLKKICTHSHSSAFTIKSLCCIKASSGQPPWQTLQYLHPLHEEFMSLLLRVAISSRKGILKISSKLLSRMFPNCTVSKSPVLPHCDVVPSGVMFTQFLAQSPPNEQCIFDCPEFTVINIFMKGVIAG